MIPNDTDSTASRLCTACGMCCNGVMFEVVELQPADSAKALAALGLKVRPKRLQTYFAQPCAALRGTCCSIYDARPVRCRLFECQQLQRVAAGAITEEAAMERIHEAQRRVQKVNALLEKTDATNPMKSLAQRTNTALDDLLALAPDPAAAQLHAALTLATQSLSALLTEEFRNRPASH